MLDVTAPQSRVEANFWDDFFDSGKLCEEVHLTGPKFARDVLLQAETSVQPSALGVHLDVLPDVHDNELLSSALSPPAVTSSRTHAQGLRAQHVGLAHGTADVSSPTLSQRSQHTRTTASNLSTWRAAAAGSTGLNIACTTFEQSLAHSMPLSAPAMMSTLSTASTTAGSPSSTCGDVSDFSASEPIVHGLTSCEMPADVPGANLQNADGGKLGVVSDSRKATKPFDRTLRRVHQRIERGSVSSLHGRSAGAQSNRCGILDRSGRRAKSNNALSAMLGATHGTNWHAFESSPTLRTATSAPQLQGGIVLCSRDGGEGEDGIRTGHTGTTAPAPSPEANDFAAAVPPAPVPMPLSTSASIPSSALLHRRVKTRQSLEKPLQPPSPIASGSSDLQGVRQSSHSANETTHVKGGPDSAASIPSSEVAPEKHEVIQRMATPSASASAKIASPAASPLSDEELCKRAQPQDPRLQRQRDMQQSAFYQLASFSSSGEGQVLPGLAGDGSSVFTGSQESMLGKSISPASSFATLSLSAPNTPHWPSLATLPSESLYAQQLAALGIAQSQQQPLRSQLDLAFAHNEGVETVPGSLQQASLSQGRARGQTASLGRASGSAAGLAVRIPRRGTVSAAEGAATRRDSMVGLGLTQGYLSTIIPAAGNYPAGILHSAPVQNDLPLPSTPFAPPQPLSAPVIASHMQMQARRDAQLQMHMQFQADQAQQRIDENGMVQLSPESVTPIPLPVALAHDEAPALATKSGWQDPIPPGAALGSFQSSGSAWTSEHSQQRKAATASLSLPARPSAATAAGPASRKLASSRRIESSSPATQKDMALPAFSSEVVTAADPVDERPTVTGALSKPSGTWEFVNYGIEDADELCAAVAPSGSYKVPLKGFVPHDGYGEAGDADNDVSGASSSRKRGQGKRSLGGTAGSKISHKRSRSDVK